MGIMFEDHYVDTPNLSYQSVALGLPISMTILIIVCVYISQCWTACSHRGRVSEDRPNPRLNFVRIAPASGKKAHSLGNPQRLDTLRLVEEGVPF